MVNIPQFPKSWFFWVGEIMKTLEFQGWCQRGAVSTKSERQVNGGVSRDTKLKYSSLILYIFMDIFSSHKIMECEEKLLGRF